MAKLVVDWPSSSLREMTLIDTPGIGSLSTDVSQRTHAFLTPETGEPTDADAVIYLMRHLHQSDLRFLEAFSDPGVAGTGPVNAVAILSRADEVSAGGLGALSSAQRIAARYRNDEKIRRVVQTVVPVAGLLAASGAALREDEFRTLATVAQAPREDMDALLLTADRFARAITAIPVAPAQRQALLERLGLFGVRLGTALVRQGLAASSVQLSNELMARSGLSELRAVLLHQFAGRRDVLQSRSALATLERVIRSVSPSGPTADGQRLLNEAERITAGAHEFAEIELLSDLRTGALGPAGRGGGGRRAPPRRVRHQHRGPPGPAARRRSRRPAAPAQRGPRPLAAPGREPVDRQGRRQRGPGARPDLRGPVRPGRRPPSVKLGVGRPFNQLAQSSPNRGRGPA